MGIYEKKYSKLVIKTVFIINKKQKQTKETI